MSLSWKIICGISIGTSHVKRGSPCQDFALTRQLNINGEQFLVIACADGAGSCSLSDKGAALACATFVELVDTWLNSGSAHFASTSENMLGWYRQVRNRLLDEAKERDASIRELSCTLLTAVVGEAASYFGQIGDGVIVVRNGDGLGAVSWPQSGEYVNTTNFVASEDFDRHLALSTVTGRLDEIAVITDGLQSLALHSATQQVHCPFFEPMFQALRASDDADDLNESLREFLSSTAVNDRTDDDKTLILASRLPPHHDSLTTPV